MSLRAVTHASEVLTGAGVRAKDGRRVEDADLGRIEDGAVVYSVREVKGVEVPERVVWVGPSREMPGEYAKVPQKHLRRRQCVVPGFVDCHTHLVFAGDRSSEFAARCAGATYQEIAAAGGGILATVRATREASAAELERLAVLRVREAMSYGIRTIEVKSGYGLSHEAEIKILETVEHLKARFPEVTFRATYLGAHALPTDRPREDYLREMMEKTLPEVARRKLADSCDIFIDEGYFTVEEGRALLGRARELGLAVKVHADELTNTDSASFAALIGAQSADHLLRVSEAGIARLAASQTVAVLLPGTAFYLKMAHAPARALIDSGAAVALATDFNPGTCMTLSLPSIMTIAALYLGMSRAELFAAVTYNAAKALGLQDRKGTLEAGRDADFAVLPFARFEESYYRFAWSNPERA